MLKINFKKNNNNFKLKKRLIKKKNKTGGNSNLLIKIKDRIIIWVIIVKILKKMMNISKKMNMTFKKNNFKQN